MTKETEYQSLLLNWGQVSLLIGQIASEILHRSIHCRSASDDYDFWAANTIHGRFSFADLTALLDAVNANGETRLSALGQDTEDTSSLDMELARALLQKKLNTTWKAECPVKEGLWLMGVDTLTLEPPTWEDDLLFVDGIAVDLRTLWPKNEFIAMLFEAGGTVGNLSEICKRHVNLYGNELYWAYPITDGEHNGAYFVLVQEGVLCLPYYEIDKDCFEIFEKDDVRLLTAEDMQYFISDWERANGLLMSAMTSLQNHLRRGEQHAA